MRALRLLNGIRRGKSNAGVYLLGEKLIDYNPIDLKEQIQVGTYKKSPIVIESGEDVWIFTSEGER